MALSEDAKDVLLSAQMLISRPEYWTKGELARDKEGNECDVLSDNATSWCIAGAMGYHTYGIGTCVTLTEEWARLEEVCTRRYGTIEVAEVNDDPKTTHQDIMNLFDEAMYGEGS